MRDSLRLRAKRPLDALCVESEFVERWKRNLYSLWTTEFLAVLGMALVLPFLPFYIRELGVKELEEVKRWSGSSKAGLSV